MSCVHSLRPQPLIRALGLWRPRLKTIHSFFDTCSENVTLVPIVICCNKFFLQQVFNNSFVFIAPATECGRHKIGIYFNMRRTHKMITASCQLSYHADTGTLPCWWSRDHLNTNSLLVDGTVEMPKIGHCVITHNFTDLYSPDSSPWGRCSRLLASWVGNSGRTI